MAAGPPAAVTLAPERPGGLDAVARLARSGVLVAIGHSDASAEVAMAAADAGARMVTHLFNAQRPLHHRDPGVVGAALDDHRLTSGLIVDLRHVDPVACRIAFAAAPGRIALATDSVANPDPARLAGTGLTLDRAVANSVAIGIDPATALDAATRVPADLLGRPDLGRLEPGALADLVWLGDDLQAGATWVGGAPAATLPLVNPPGSSSAPR